MVDEPEVCQWGLLANELNDPTYDVCVIAAIALKDQNDLRQTASSTSASGGYSNYDCAKIPIANMPELRVNEDIESLDGEVAQRGLVCPQITINDSSTHKRITLKRFVIADGNGSQNSVFVFGFSDNTCKEMNLLLYMNGIFRINMIAISDPSVAKFRSEMSTLERGIELKDLCNSPITERQNVCKYSAMKKYANYDGDFHELGSNFGMGDEPLDRSGFVPYRCVKRFSALPFSVTEEIDLHFGSAMPEDYIYCPRQLIRLGDSVTVLTGFFYTISDDMYEKQIHIRDNVLPSTREDHRIEEETVIPFPKRG